MRKSRFSLKSKIMLLAVIPSLAIGILLTIYCSYTCYRNVYEEVELELHSMCVSVYEFLQREKGADEFIFSEPEEIETVSSYFSGIKSNTNIDITLFKGDTRFITSIIDNDGNIVAGTKASEKVVEEVIEHQNHYYSDDIDISGIMFFGYYMPVLGDDGSVIGMTFAGKSRSYVEKTLVDAEKNALLISLSITFIAVIASILISAKITYTLGKAVEFMDRIALGDMECSPDRDLVERGDEIGIMGRAAVTLQQSLKKLISTDLLTGLLNRRMSVIRLEELQKEGKEYTVVMSDIDFFKSFNDTYGHSCGDDVLKFVSETFVEFIGGSVFAARWGGEEFLIIFNGCDYESAVGIVNDIRAYIKEHGVRSGEKELKLTLTFGIQKCGKDMPFEKAINLADEKLYYGKNNGRDRIVEEIPQQS